MENKLDDPLLPTRPVAKRYNVVPRTVDRWVDREDLGFPKPILIAGRRYWRLSELVAWEKAQATHRANASPAAA